MTRRRTGAGTIAALTLTLVFGLTLLLGLAAGAGVYRRVTERVEQSQEDRVGLTYLAAKLRGWDEAGQLRVGLFDGLPAVFLLQQLDGAAYETALYVHDGWLKELLYEQGWPLEPGDGEPITQAQALEAGWEREGLLHLLYTGSNGREESLFLCIRSEG